MLYQSRPRARDIRVSSLNTTVVPDFSHINYCFLFHIACFCPAGIRITASAFFRHLRKRMGPGNSLSPRLRGNSRPGIRTAWFRLLRGVATVYAVLVTVRATFYLASNIYQQQYHSILDRHDTVAAPVDSALLLAGSFGASIHPNETEIIPYFYQAKRNPIKKDITICTIMTLGRVEMFERLASIHDGPISVTIHVTKRDMLPDIDAMWAANPLMRQNVDIHVIISPHLREFNTYRNMARLFARTDYIFQFDVDFATTTDFRNRIISDERLMNMLEQGNNAFVVPAFQYRRDANVEPSLKDFPKTKEELLPIYKAGRGDIECFYHWWKPSHAGTNYTYWIGATDIYPVTQWNTAYEPYVIIKRNSAPWCDARFIGYGDNKVSCLFEYYVSGQNFWVLPEDFIIHQTHSNLNAARKVGFEYNRGLYVAFQEEVCLRYLNFFAQSGDLDTSRAENMYTQCRQYDGFRKWEKQIISITT
ncbi:glycosyl-transferase for dystroglycan-domain-containing protein [Naematelia encephala]|uniref:Glycosyl-transferase for dystroglycan-domain-containing protein n=1 Tax=Naematelia encephala TaxID=71784 RepID=A0A1Y2ASK4_9TREE|nr:glycosyl-transferase for dystroglycan-domain-containing protein [Naematelia encephala]